MDYNAEHCGAILDDLSEKVNYDYPDYPVYIRRNLLSTYIDYCGQAHLHPDIEFIYVYSGDMNYSVNGQVIPLRAGEGIFVNSGQIHYGFSDHRECDFLCLIFSPDVPEFSASSRVSFITPVISNHEFQYCKLTDKCDWHRKILSILSSLPFNHDSLDIFDLQSAIAIIWKELFRNMPAASGEISPDSDDLAITSNMLEYIRNHYAEKITLAAIAASGGVSVSKCCILFSRYLGTSPMNFLTGHRIKIASQMLCSTDFQITDIAGATGFSGSSYFSETFRKVTGMTPRDYRTKFRSVYDSAVS